MKKLNFILVLLISLIVSFLCVHLTDFSNKYYEAREVYSVYIEGKSIGLINSKENLEKFEQNKKFNLTFYQCSDINIITSLEYSSVPVVVLVTPTTKVELTDSSISMDEEELSNWIEQNIGD